MVLEEGFLLNLICWSAVLPTICWSEFASKSSMMVPFSMQFFSWKSEWRDRVATWGLLHRSPPFSTFSSNFIHLRKTHKTHICSDSSWIKFRDIIPGTALIKCHDNTIFGDIYHNNSHFFFSMDYDNVLCAMRILHFLDIYHHNTPIYCWSFILIILWFYYGAYMYICFGHVL